VRPPGAGVSFGTMSGASKAILGGACAGVTLSLTVGAAAPGLVVVAAASLAGLVAARRAPTDAAQWFSVQLVMAVTIGAFAWDVRSHLAGVLAIVLLGVALAFALLATINYLLRRLHVPADTPDSGDRL
jgi:hypothetical protein